MRWLVCQPGPAFSVHDVFAGWVEALKDLGQDVHIYNLDERLTFFDAMLMKAEPEGMFKKALTAEQVHDMAADTLNAALYQTWPDVLLVISGFFIPPKILDRARRTRTRVVIIHTESPYEDQRQAEMANHADLNLINDPTNIDDFPRGTRYMPQAYRPSVHHPGDPTPGMVCDLGFVGTSYPSRVEFFERMDLTGLDVILAGSWGLLEEGHPLHQYVPHDVHECLDNDQAANLYRSARVGLNLYRREAQKPELSAGWACGPREIEMAACGLFFLRDPRPESNELFPFLPAFTSPEEASELLRYWLGRPEERERLAAKAREVIADRTFLLHAKQILRLLGA